MKKTIIIDRGSAGVRTRVLAQDAAKTPSAADKLGWQMAIHAYTFRKFSIFECIDKTAALGLKYMSLSGSREPGRHEQRHDRQPLRQGRPGDSRRRLRPKASSW